MGRFWYSHEPWFLNLLVMIISVATQSVVIQSSALPNTSAEWLVVPFYPCMSISMQYLTGDDEEKSNGYS
jgi:hypothetical protein